LSSIEAEMTLFKHRIESVIKTCNEREDAVKSFIGEKFVQCQLKVDAVIMDAQAEFRRVQTNMEAVQSKLEIPYQETAPAINVLEDQGAVAKDQIDTSNNQDRSGNGFVPTKSMIPENFSDHWGTGGNGRMRLRIPWIRQTQD
jgi:hypothetical protein